MSEEEKKATEEVILEAAKKVFTHKGFAGARMQEIADLAGINKALLHYYFRSKDKLFEAVFRDTVQKMVPAFRDLLLSDVSFEEKIARFFSTHIGFLQANPFLPGFVIQELGHNPERLVELFQMSQLPFHTVLEQMTQMQAKGAMVPIDPRHILINMLSLSIFPFVAKPLLMTVFGFTEETYMQFLNERKQILPEMMFKTLKLSLDENAENKN